jgi:hypothetical protein
VRRAQGDVTYSSSGVMPFLAVPVSVVSHGGIDYVKGWVNEGVAASRDSA